MRAIVIHGKLDLRADELTAPEPGEGEVLLRMAYGGICGSDLHYYNQGANGEFVVRLLDVSGNEVAWRQIARDGADLPAEAIRPTAARTRVDVGITKDFELTPDQPGEMVLEVDHRRPGHPTRLTIRVR